MIQWGVAALLALLLLLWVNGEQPDPQPELPPPAKPEPAVEVVAEKELPAEPAPVPEPVVAETPEMEPEPVVAPVEEEPIPEPVPDPLSLPEAEPLPKPELLEEQISEESMPPCPQWTDSMAVSRGTFTLGVDRVSREPLDSVCRPTSEVRKIFYFSDLRNQFGKRIYHLWEYNGREMAKVALGRVGGPRWRVWSSKNIAPGWGGEWSVKVVTEDGTVLHQESFEYLAE